MAPSYAPARRRARAGREELPVHDSCVGRHESRMRKSSVPPAGRVGAASRAGWDAGVGRWPQPAAVADGHHRARPAPPRAPHGPASSMRRDMIRMRTDFFAESLGMGTSMVVLMPQAAAGIGMA